MRRVGVPTLELPLALSSRSNHALHWATVTSPIARGGRFQGYSGHPLRRQTDGRFA
jgi:hypothetical protein